MGDKTGIEWTDATWNPVRGCSRVSDGCRNCYAEKVAARFSDCGQPYEGFADRKRAGSAWTGRVAVMWPLIDLPLRWRRPRRIFVNSMSDLFHESLPLDEIANVYAVAIAAHLLRGHTLQILTKRAERMRHMLASPDFWAQVNAEVGGHVMERTNPLDRRSDDARARCDEYGPDDPPPGVWLGVSVENQAVADERIPHLLATPAAVRFLSCEPLLGPLDLCQLQPCDPPVEIDSLNGTHGVYRPHGGTSAKVQWVIAGGESGSGARPMQEEWAQSLRDQCEGANVPFFFKQWGEFAPTAEYRDGKRFMSRVGKRAAGALLDGREHKAFPA